MPLYSVLPAFEQIATWPDMRRSLSYESFERISKGHDDGRFGDFAPLYRSLTLSRGAGRPLDWKPKLFATFFAHPVCRALAVLDVSCNYYLPVAFAELLARSPLLENLHTISFDRVHFGNDGVLAFARAAHWTNLRELDLRGTDIDASVLPVLAGSVFARDLRSLALAGDTFGPLARELHAFPALRRLGLSRGTTFDAAAVRAMLESDVLPDLEQLALSYWEDSDLEPLRAIRPGLAITR